MSLSDYLQMPFVQNALLVGVLVALCASLLGVAMRRMLRKNLNI